MSKAPGDESFGALFMFKVRRLAVGGFAGEFEEFDRQMTIAVGVLVQIVLMVLVGGEEVAQRRNLRHDRLIVQLLFFIEDAFDHWKFRLVCVIHTRTVARATSCPWRLSNVGSMAWKNMSIRNSRLTFVSS